MAWITEEDVEFENDGEFWNPEKDDSIQGVVKTVKKGQYDKLFMVIEDDEGNTWLTTQCAGLDYQIKKMNVGEDDIVCLTYNGRNENNSHNYLLQKWVEDDDDSENGEEFPEAEVVRDTPNNNVPDEIFEKYGEY